MPPCKYLREAHGIISVILVRIGRPTAKPLTDYSRRWMRTLLRTKRRRRRYFRAATVE